MVSRSADRPIIRAPRAALLAGVLAGFAWYLLSPHAGEARLVGTDQFFPRGEVDDRIVVVGFDLSDRPTPPGSTGAALSDFRDALFTPELVTQLRSGGAAAVGLVGFDSSRSSLQLENVELSGALRTAGNVVLTLTDLIVEDSSSGPPPASAYTVDPRANERTTLAAGWPGREITRGGRVTPLMIRVGDLEPGSPWIRKPDDTTAAAKVLPSLPIAVLLVAERAKFSAELSDGTVVVAERRVPVERGHLLRVSYAEGLRDHRSPAVVNAYDIYAGRIPPSAFADKIVLVGVTDPRGPAVPVPGGVGVNQMPDVLLQANALNTILTSSYLRPLGRGESALSIGVIAAVITGIAVVSRVLFLPVLAAAAGLAHVLLTRWLFGRDVLVELVPGLVAIAVGVIVAVAERVLRDRRSRARMTALISQYVPTPVARQLLARAGSGLPQGTITFLMTDVVGSTRAWEDAPGAMRVAMRHHDKIVEDAVTTNGGAVVRPRGEGDSRFAVFVQTADAARAARDIHLALESDSRTPVHLQLRTAIHLGEGELREADYYGSDVNRCARLRATADPGQILVSTAAAAVLDQAPHDLELRDLGSRDLRDLSPESNVYELLARRGTATSSRGASEALR